MRISIGEFGRRTAKKKHMNVFDVLALYQRTSGFYEILGIPTFPHSFHTRAH
jgi:hypothetical protein